MSIAAAWQQCLAFLATPLVIEPSPCQLSGDAGLLPIRQFNIGLAYSSYNDSRPQADYFAWLEDVFAAVLRMLTPHGSRQWREGGLPLPVQAKRATITAAGRLPDQQAGSPGRLRPLLPAVAGRAHPARSNPS